MKIRNKIIAGSAIALATVGASFAEGGASTVATGVDFSDVALAAAAIGGTLATAYVAIKGIKIVIGMIKGG